MKRNKRNGLTKCLKPIRRLAGDKTSFPKKMSGLSLSLRGKKIFRLAILSIVVIMLAVTDYRLRHQILMEAEDANVVVRVERNETRVIAKEKEKATRAGFLKSGF